MDSNRDTEQPVRPALSRRARDQQSFESQFSEESSCVTDIMDMVMLEKAAAIFPEKASAMDTLHESATSASYPTISDKSTTREVSEASVPGAFRVGKSRQHSSEQSVSTDSISSCSSESCVIVIPRASLVQDEDKDVKTSDKDLEAAKADIPFVVADKAEDSLVRDVPKAKRNRSRILCLSVLFCMLLIMGLLTGILVVLLRNNKDSPTSVEINPNRDNLPSLPTQGKDGPRPGNQNDGNWDGDDRDSDDRDGGHHRPPPPGGVGGGKDGPSGGGGGDRGN